MEKWNKQKLSDKDFADTVEHQILPPWKSERDAIANLKRLPADQNKFALKVVKYMDKRTESWTLLVQGLRSGDASAVNQAFSKSREADNLVKTISTE